MSWMNTYKAWRDFRELWQMTEWQLKDAFYAQLGPGRNRVNIYTVRKVTEGLARYI
ncbi:hypothetical protein [Priestia aryabhattai]|uniref:hypothetical protein n=1 Tax=Priestia aryabhattai TaxID=412384 RepID=UPI003BF8122A